MPSEFDQHTAVHEAGPGRYDVELNDGWRVAGGLNGGYLLAVIGNAARAALPGKPDPVAVSAHYLTASRAGPATVSTRILREGRSVATVSAELRQGDQARMAVLATFGDLDSTSADIRTTAREPDLPAVEHCIGNQQVPVEFHASAPLIHRIDLRLDPACVGFALGKPTGAGRLQGWFRLPDGREPDPISLLMVIDALPPVSVDLGATGWPPTLELTVHVRARPAPGWLKVAHRTRNVAGGMFEEDCEVWDSTGRLVAQSRQLARLPR
jgi:acyl-CoA thioesterase